MAVASTVRVTFSSALHASAIRSTMISVSASDTRLASVAATVTLQVSWRPPTTPMISPVHPSLMSAVAATSTFRYSRCQHCLTLIMTCVTITYIGLT